MRDLINSIIVIVMSVAFIALGIILTITFVFAFVGIPFVILGAALLLGSILALAFDTIGEFFDMVMAPFRGVFHRRKTRRKERKKSNEGKVVEVEKEGDVYRAKT